MECRIHKNIYPEIDEIVVIKVKEITSDSIFVNLLEYGNIEGLVVMSQLSRKFVRSIRKIIHVDKIDIAQIVNINKEKGYIDLSIKNVVPADIEKKFYSWNLNKKIYNILCQFTHSYKPTISINEIYSSFGWDLDEKYGNLYDGLMAVFNGKECLPECLPVDLPVDFPVDLSVDLSVDFPDALKNFVVEKLNEHAVLKKTISLKCFEYDGVKIIKKALIRALNLDPEKISIILVSSPVYLITIEDPKMEVCVKLMEEVIETIRNDLGVILD